MNNNYLNEPGVITWSELMALELGKEYFCDEERLQAIFAQFDDDGKGFFNLEDVEKVFNRFGRSIAKEKLREIINDLDANSDSVIDFEEFKSLMTITGLSPPKKMLDIYLDVKKFKYGNTRTHDTMGCELTKNLSEPVSRPRVNSSQGNYSPNK